jgi:hypothetical protein
VLAGIFAAQDCCVETGGERFSGRGEYHAGERGLRRGRDILPGCSTIGGSNDVATLTYGQDHLALARDGQQQRVASAVLVNGVSVAWQAKRDCRQQNQPYRPA